LDCPDRCPQVAIGDEGIGKVGLMGFEDQVTVRGIFGVVAEEDDLCELLGRIDSQDQDVAPSGVFPAPRLLR
jgi:hypothetical protein